ncbi:MAG: 50S ribosomal protein L9, partial [Candidatus Binatia bacterium]
AMSAAEQLAKKLGTMAIAIGARAGDEGKLFGSVTNIDIERALADAGTAIERRRIRLDEPIKSLGEYKVPVSLAAGVQAEVTVTVTRLEEEA